MKYNKTASMYSIFVGISMVIMWIVFYTTDGIPELQTKPVELIIHLVAEMLTALLLIVGAVGLLLNKKWGLHIHLISTGMLIYTLIMSAGYFLQKSDIACVVMFIILLILTIGLTSLLLLKNENL